MATSLKWQIVPDEPFGLNSDDFSSTQSEVYIMQVEYSRGFRGLVPPVAIATSDGAHAVNPAIESAIDDAEIYIEHMEDKHREAVVETLDDNEDERCDEEEVPYYRLFRFRDSLPAKVGSFRAAELEGFCPTFTADRTIKSCSMDRAKYRRRALERRLQESGWRLVGRRRRDGIKLNLTEFGWRIVASEAGPSTLRGRVVEF
jgi:hypothetical protein